MKKVTLTIKALFAVAAVCTMAEYLAICGMFAGPLMMAICLLLGAVNVVIAAKQHSKETALLYAIATLALCMGYAKLMF